MAALPAGFELVPTSADPSTAGPSGPQLPPGFELVTETQRGRAALNGLTFGLGPRVMAGSRALMSSDTYSDALKDEQEKLEAYRKAEPFAAAGYEIAGSLPTLLVPGVGAVGNANRIRMAAQAGTSAAARQAATQAGIRSLGHEVGRGGAQLGALQAGLHSKDYTDPMQVAEDAAKGAGFGYVGGRIINGVAQPLINSIGNAREALAVGSSARGSALRALRGSADEQGTDLAQVARSVMPEPVRGMTPDAQQAIVGAHAEAIASGATEVQARQAAAAAYAATRPLNARGQQLAGSTMDGHVASTIADYRALNRTPLIAAEVLSGADRPIQGEMKSLTQSIANGTGEGRTVLAGTLRTRQEGAIPRSRELIDTTIGANIPGGGRDYVGAMNAIDTASRAARNAAYGEARARARSFDIDPVLQRFRGIADENAGAPRAELQNAVNSMQDWYVRMTERLRELSPSQRGVGDNQILLNSYRQARSAVEGDIQRLAAAPGGRESAALLRMFKREMDTVVRRRNPQWWRANNGTAETFRIQEAAQQGRTVPLREGAASQELRAAMTNDMSAPEREATRLGIARQMHDEVSRLGDDHDVSKIFMRGGGDQMEEGMRGLINDVLGHAGNDARARAVAAAQQRGVSSRAVTTAGNRARAEVPTAENFYQQMEREKIARASFQLDKGSPTNALAEAGKKRNVVMQAAMNLIHNPNPLQVLTKLTEYAAQKAGARRDAELGRMLSITTDRPDQLLALVRELARTSAATRDPFTPVASRLAARSVPMLSAETADGMTRPRRANRSLLDGVN